MSKPPQSLVMPSSQQGVVTMGLAVRRQQPPFRFFPLNRPTNVARAPFHFRALQQQPPQLQQQQQQQQQQQPPRKRAPHTQRKRTNLEWRNAMLEIYSGRLRCLQDSNPITLRKYCYRDENIAAPQYKRIAFHWKSLGLEDHLSSGCELTNPALVKKINAAFPVDEANSQEQIAPPIRRRSKEKNVTRTNLEWQRLLKSLFDFLSSARAADPPRKESIRSYCLKVLGDVSLCRRVQEIWKALDLQHELDNGVTADDDQLKAKLEVKFPAEQTETRANAQDSDSGKTNSRDLRPSSNSYFDRYEERTLCECVSGMAKAGFPLEKSDLKAYADAFLEADNIQDGANSTGGISMDTVERIYKMGGIKAKTNVDPIDPKRAAQADPLVLNSFYAQIDAWAKIVHEINPEAWPEDRYANVPPSRIYNTDEQGPNPTQLRNPVLIPKDMVTRSRLFQNTREGDGKMPFHYSVANIVRADGAQSHPKDCVEGAPAPYVIISDASSGNEIDNMERADRDKVLANQTEADVIQINPLVLDGWFDDLQVGKRNDLVNKYGFQVRTTPTGSMLKRIFYDFLLHFAKQLPHMQGPGGLGVWLFLDWHCSRECPQSLLFAFFKYNVLIVVLPAKTSIWSQPCDNGKNELTAKDIAKSAHDQGLLAGRPMDYQDANSVFRKGLETNCDNQNDELRRTGTNAVVSSFAKTGIYPMNYDNDGWKAAIESFGKLNSIIKERKISAGETVPDTLWTVCAIPKERRQQLSEDDKKALQSFLSTKDFLGSHDNSSDRIEIPDLFLAVAIAECLLGNHVLDQGRVLSQAPMPTNDYETAALKLVEYVAVTVNHRVDVTCTLSTEEIARDRLTTKLSVLKLGKSIALRKKADGAEINVTKQSPSQFVAIDNDLHTNDNLRTLSFTQVLDLCFDRNDDDAYRLTKKDVRKGQKKARIARKTLNNALYAEAIEIADERRLKRNWEDIGNQLKAELPDFASDLATLLEQHDLDMSVLYDRFEAVAFKPYDDTITVGSGQLAKEIDVTRVGPDISAVSHKMETVFLKLMLELRSSGGEKAKRKRRRGAGQSTHLGKCGITQGILIQRQHQQEELQLLAKEEKAALDELERLKALCNKAVELQQQLPTQFWKWESVKGKRREVLARLFGVFKSGAKAADINVSLKSLELTKATVVAKIEELRSEVETKEAAIQPIVAKRREKEDFLVETAEYTQSAVNQNNDDDSDGE